MDVKNVPIIRYTRGSAEELDDPVIREQWLDLYLNGQFLMGTPVIDREIEELVYGYVFMEGYIRSGERIDLEKRENGWFAGTERDVEIRSVKELVDCAYSRIAKGEKIDKVESGCVLDAEKILDLVKSFQKLPSVYHETGGVHMAAFASGDNIVRWSDDISRRNAVDKVLGKLFLSDTDPSAGFIITSGRVSSDIVLRMIRARIPVIVSISAPTVKALEMAAEYGITVCGFARGRRFNAYTNTQRISF